MTIRSDLTVNWTLSPRIIEVAAPSVSLNAQDLYDTLRDLASKPDALDDDEIVDAGGKEILDATRSVVITVTLKNAKVKFEDRSQWTVCEITGNLVALDSGGQPMSPIEPAAYVTVDRAKDTAGVMLQDADINAIKAKTDNLPATPADESSLQDLRDKVGVPTSTVAGDLEYIEDKVEPLPPDPADQSEIDAQFAKIKRGASFRG